MWLSSAFKRTAHFMIFPVLAFRLNDKLIDNENESILFSITISYLYLLTICFCHVLFTLSPLLYGTSALLMCFRLIW